MALLPVPRYSNKQKGRELQVRALIKGPRSPTHETQNEKPRPIGRVPVSVISARKLGGFGRNNDCVNADYVWIPPVPRQVAAAPNLRSESFHRRQGYGGQVGGQTGINHSFSSINLFPAIKSLSILFP